MLNEKNIEEFLNEYKRSRVIIETTVRATLKRASEYEVIFNKDFYSFTKEETLIMFKAVGAISLTSLQNQKLTLIHAARFYLNRQGIPTSNIYEEVTKDDLSECLDADRKKNRLITREQLNNIQGELFNKVDSALIELMFLGAGNKPWMRDLLYLEKEQVSKSDMCIYLRSGYIIPLDKRAYKIIIDAFNETEMISYTEEMKVTQVYGGIYKMRFNTITDNSNMSDEEQAERRYRFSQRRLAIISEYVGIKLTAKALNSSGFLHFAKEEMKLMEISDFKTYLRTEQGRSLAARYGFHGSNMVYVVFEKFKDYI